MLTNVSQYEISSEFKCKDEIFIKYKVNPTLKNLEKIFKNNEPDIFTKPNRIYRFLK